MAKNNYYILFCFNFLFINLIFSQENNGIDSTLNNCQCKSAYNELYCEVEGYKVLEKIENQPFNEHGLFVLRNRYFIDKNTKSFTDKSLNKGNITYVLVEKGYSAKPRYLIYTFVKFNENNTKLIHFIIEGDRDKKLEQNFVTAFLNNKINATYMDFKKDSVKIGNKNYQFSNNNTWVGPHNIRCENFGQISWAEFYLKDKADLYMEVNKIFIKSNKKNIPKIKIIEEKEIQILFDNIECKATYYKSKINIPKILIGGSNILNAYTFIAKINNKYVCINISYYDDEAPINELPKKLNNIMLIKK